MKLLKHFTAILTFIITTLSLAQAHESNVELDYFKVSKSSTGHVSLHCGLSDQGIQMIKEDYGWLPHGDVLMFEASENYVGPVLSDGQPVFLLNRWSIYYHGISSLSFQRADGTHFEVELISAPYLRVCVVDVDLLDEIIEHL